MKKVMFIIFLVVAINGLNTATINATTINIPTDKSTIQAGITVANNGDTVLVDTGIYSENINFTGKKIILASKFILTGDTSYISQTVIRGNNTAPVVTFSSNEDSSAVLIGFTITGGACGVYCYNSNPRIKYSAIINNISNDLAGLYFGAGIYCFNSSPVLSYIKIMNNISILDGGGIFCSNSSPMMINVIISGNRSIMGDGGGLYCISHSAPNVRNTTIINNSAGWYGGGIACYESNPNLDSVVISQNNSLSWYGGGFYCSNSNPILKNVLITKNKVYESVGIGSGGGGICSADKSNPILLNVTISRNTAKVAGGGIYVDDYSNITFDTAKRCNIYLNNATVEYEIYSYTTKIHLVVDTFTVINPKNEHAYPIGNYTFDILHSKVTQDLSKLYVSPKGDDGNSGSSWDEPLKTIGFAKSIINGTFLKPATIYLDSGTYSLGTNGEHYELSLSSYISLKGRGVNKTILKSDNQVGVLFYSSVVGDTVEVYWPQLIKHILRN